MFKAVVVAAALALAAFGGRELSTRWFFVDEVVVVGGDAGARARAKELLRPLRGKNLLWMSLRKEQAKLLAELPSAQSAALRRELPQTLRATLRLRAPLARFAGGGVVDGDGVRFAGEGAGLPIFVGDAKRLPQMAAFYRRARALAPSAKVAQVEVLPRGGWRVFLQSGEVLRLGRQNTAERLARYARHAAAARARFPNLRAVDLRYPNGFALVGSPPAGQKKGADA